MPIEQCIRIGLRLTEALQHLHENGLVHRDVKPSNIIFVNGLPKLADVGLVTQIEDAQSLVGTAGYVPPEGPGTPQAELFSLSRVLYEISTGKCHTDFPEAPTNVGQLPDRRRRQEFDAIVLKAGQHDPKRRFQTAAEMHQELKTIAAGKSIARRRFIRRVTRPKAIGVSLMLIVLSILGFVFVPKAPAPPSAEAMTFYENAGKNYVKFSTKGFQDATEQIQLAIGLEPNYAPFLTRAVTILLDSCEWLGPSDDFVSRAHIHAKDAVEIDPREPRAWVALAATTQLLNWDWKTSETHRKRAIERPRRTRGQGQPMQISCHSRGDLGNPSRRLLPPRLV